MPRMLRQELRGAIDNVTVFDVTDCGLTNQGVRDASGPRRVAPDDAHRNHFGRHGEAESLFTIS